ncbi:hypothetical protein GPAL_2056 [Glaciecola pallidula DSM 14239 = ACAM 615]|uniref:Uncharacterized protein n=1 Tax=Brumicola pallidula DSM 14239 = ACAM 615 TaxID=1121922 RepID=K6ZEZ6_9ALTE|nr:hypothetical protein GPAL_2056 [Glaciecola pallidula DSM 14239 = ACAM 615]
MTKYTSVTCYRHHYLSFLFTIFSINATESKLDKVSAANATIFIKSGHV